MIVERRKKRAENMHKHSFIDKHPIGVSILMGLFMKLLHEFISTILMTAHAYFIDMPSDLMIIIYLTIATAVVFLLYMWWHYPEFIGIKLIKKRK